MTEWVPVAQVTASDLPAGNVEMQPCDVCGKHAILYLSQGRDEAAACSLDHLKRIVQLTPEQERQVRVALTG